MRRASCKSLGTAEKREGRERASVTRFGGERERAQAPHHPLPLHKENKNALIVTRLAWMAHRLVSSNRWTIKSSVAWGGVGGRCVCVSVREKKEAQRVGRFPSPPPFLCLLTSCRASRASAVHRKGSGATPLVISRAWGSGRNKKNRACEEGRAWSLSLQARTRALPPPPYSLKRFLTSRAKGSLRMSSSVDRWYLRISRRATVPGRYRRLPAARAAARPWER